MGTILENKLYFFFCEVSKGTSNSNDYLTNLPFFHLFQRGDFPQDYQDL